MAFDRNSSRTYDSVTRRHHDLLVTLSGTQSFGLVRHSGVRQSSSWQHLFFTVYLNDETSHIVSGLYGSRESDGCIVTSGMDIGKKEKAVYRLGDSQGMYAGIH
ncbi:unnamed protein product [Menidia menidia]|uniref:(Atlantic silverside) hypothetical protein n=1 Tax=Menidia menidia TaxID=238744 RepID=A0A8S4BR65_9TELE|nr:unnamed protein product [Menidia menidia]